MLTKCACKSGYRSVCVCNFASIRVRMKVWPKHFGRCEFVMIWIGGDWIFNVWHALPKSEYFLCLHTLVVFVASELFYFISFLQVFYFSPFYVTIFLHSISIFVQATFSSTISPFKAINLLLLPSSVLQNKPCLR